MLIPPHVRVLEALIEAIQVRRKARAVKARVLETPSLMQDLLQVYKAIKTENPASTRKVHVFVSTLEADSVCAFRILRGILCTDNINFQSEFVGTNTQLEAAFRAAFKGGDKGFSTVIFINCGASENSLAWLRPEPTVRLVFIDSRRPIHHNLVHASQEHALVVTAEEDIGLVGAGAVPPQDGDSSAGSSGDEENEDPGSSGQKRRREAELSTKASRKRRRQAVRQRRAEYYRVGLFWGPPATLIMLQLAQSLEQEDVTTYWCAAVALADHYTRNRISMERYNNHANELQDMIAGLGDVEKDITCTARDEMGQRMHTTARTRLPSTWIEPVDDLIFPMLTRWNLRDAMMHCPYTAARLQTFRDKGKGKLDMLLARMGFTRQKAELEYSMMPTATKKKLRARLDEMAPSVALTSLKLNGFRLHWEYKSPLSAADAARILTALLGSHLTQPQSVANEADAFWKALHALERDQEPMEMGIALAKDILTSALTSCSYIAASQRDSGACSRLDTTGFSAPCRDFYVLRLSEQHAIHNPVAFAQPAALFELGALLRECMNGETKRKRRGILVFGPTQGESDEMRRCAFVCDHERPKLTDSEGNWAPLLLREAAHQIKCELEVDSFDGATGEVALARVEALVMKFATKATQMST